MAITPVLQALLLADRVYREEETGKSVIAGTFDSIFVPECPTEFRETYAYICLVNVHGTIAVKLEYVDLSNNEVLMEFGPINITAPNPLASIDFAVPVPPLPMPHEGMYALELFAGNEQIGMARVNVQLLEEEHEEDENEEEEEDFT